MPRLSPPVLSFNAGELSPRLRGRTDINKYSAGCRTMENFIPLVHGPAVRRPGTEYVAEIRNSANDVRLIPFVFSATQSYILEFGDEYIRFYSAHAQILFNRNVSGCVDNGSGLIRVSTAEAHGYATGDKVTITGVLGTTEANGSWTITVIDSTHFDLQGSAFVHTYTSGGTISAAYQITAPWSKEDLRGLKFVQEADVMYIVHPSYKPYKLSRFGDTTWTLAAVDFKNGPWMDENTVEELEAQLCPDGDMEDNTGWTSVGTPTVQERSADRAYHGAYSRKFTVDAAGEGIKSGTWSTSTGMGDGQPGSLYVVRFRIFTDTGNVRIRVATGYTGDAVFNLDESISSVPKNQWTEYEFYYKEQARGTGAYLEIVNATGTTGTWYIDQVEVFKVSTILMSCNATSGTCTMTCSDDYFTTDHVGAMFRLDHDGEYGTVVFKTWISATQGTVDVVKQLKSTRQTAQWREGAFSEERGYPGAIAFHEQALWLAGTAAEPQTLWRSVVGQYENFEPGTNAADSLKYKIASEQANTILWLASMTNLIIGTINGEWRLGPRDANDPIKPDNIKITQQSGYGCANISPINLRNVLLFVQRLGNPANCGVRVRELSYRFESDAYLGTDLTLLADHIAEYGITEWTFQTNPHPIAWAALRNGKLIGLTYEKDQEVYAWHKHQLGGSGKVLSVATVPGSYQEELWLVVERDLTGLGTKRYIEYMTDFDWGAILKTPGFVSGAGYQARAWFVDCGKGATGGAPAYVFGGLDHLIGQTVQIYADGAVVADQVVDASGQVTLEEPFASIRVGLKYISDLEPMDLEAATQEGTAQGKRKRIHEVGIKLYETIGGWAGPDADNLDEIITRTTEPLGSPPNLYTDDYDLPFPGGYTKNARLLIRQDKPVPMTVLCLLPRWGVEDR